MENTNIDIGSLSQHFTEEEIATVLPKDEAQNAEVVEEQAEQQEVEQTEEPSQPDSDIVQEEKPQKLKPTVIAYDRFKEVNDKAKALAAELAAMKAQKPVERPVEQPRQMNEQQTQTEAKAKYYATLSATADKQAREILGINDADLTELQFVDNPKYQALLDTRATIVQEMHRDNMMAFQVRQANEQYVATLQQDPLFIPVYQYAKEIMAGLPSREVKAFEAAEARIMQFSGTNADFALVNEKVDEYKAKYLASTGQSAPSQVSVTHTKAPLDKAEGLPRASNLSGAKTAAMSWQQVEQLIRDGKADQIPKEMLAQIDPKLIE